MNRSIVFVLIGSILFILMATGGVSAFFFNKNEPADTLDACYETLAKEYQRAVVFADKFILSDIDGVHKRKWHTWFNNWRERLDKTRRTVRALAVNDPLVYDYFSLAVHTAYTVYEEYQALYYAEKTNATGLVAAKQKFSAAMKDLRKEIDFVKEKDASGAYTSLYQP